jgi:ankyrin repeat protein
MLNISQLISMLMSGVGLKFAAMAILTSSAVVISCKDRKDHVSTDLQEAGFQVTAEDWFRACREGNVEVMKKFLSAGFSKDTLDAEGNTSLHVAVVAGQEGVADFLLRKGIPIDVKGAKGRTPLMAAAAAGKADSVGWLLRQGADPQAKDDEGYKALMISVREGNSKAVEQLAPYDREDLDSALLLAALLGKANVIDSLTNYGASVYSRMEDGRTPLMIAAENGHGEAVKLLIDLGSSRYTVDGEGRTAAVLAEESGHAEIASLILQEPAPDDLALPSPEEISTEMDVAVDAAMDPSREPQVVRNAPAGADQAAGGAKRGTAPIDGAVIGLGAAANAEQAKSPSRKTPPVVMRYYRETDVPIQVERIQGDAAVLKISGGKSREVVVKPGENFPGSSLYVIRAGRRMEQGKLTNGKEIEISVVTVEDRRTGQTREWISGRPATAHDPIALLEDPVTGKRYTAKPGHRFRSADGGEFLISDVRSNQVVIEDLASGEVQTVLLHGPRG